MNKYVYMVMFAGEMIAVFYDYAEAEDYAEHENSLQSNPSDPIEELISEYYVEVIPVQ